MPELLKEIAGPLGVLILAFAGILSWKLGELRKAKEIEQSNKMPSAVAAAGTIGQLRGATDHHLVADAITDGMKCLCDKTDEWMKCNREDERELRHFHAEMRGLFNGIREELANLARANSRISKAMEEQQHGR